jgi:hypothetical protein
LAEAPTNVAPCSHWHSRRRRPSRVCALIVLETAPCSRSSGRLRAPTSTARQGRRRKLQPHAVPVFTSCAATLSVACRR